MAISINVDATDIEELEADDRGRVTLGSEYANQTVVVAVIDEKADESE